MELIKIDKRPSAARYRQHKHARSRHLRWSHGVGPLPRVSPVATKNTKGHKRLNTATLPISDMCSTDRDSQAPVDEHKESRHNRSCRGGQSKERAVPPVEKEEAAKKTEESVVRTNRNVSETSDETGCRTQATSSVQTP